MSNAAFLQPLTCPFNKSVALTDSVIKTLTFKSAADVVAGTATVLAKRVGIKTIVSSTSGYTGKIYYKMFPERQAVASANNVDNTCVSLQMGENLVDIPVYVSRIQFLSVDPATVGVSLAVEAWSDMDISGSSFA